jgi:hypothetical protein
MSGNNCQEVPNVTNQLLYEQLEMIEMAWTLEAETEFEILILD